MEITVNEIEKVLDGYLEKRLEGDKCIKNVILCDEAEDIRYKNPVYHWLEKNENVIYREDDLQPGLLYDESDDGILTPSVPERYVLPVSKKFFNAQNAVVYYSMIQPILRIHENIVKDFICKREYSGPDGEISTLNNVFLCVIDCSKSTLYDLPKEILDCSDVYEVILP
ncbi:MAG: hypothetical protein J6Z34_03145 [Clostridia bacterium]|nr:hypothetical protein [Clostridia bacterium]